jgi:hypothetical protein
MNLLFYYWYYRILVELIHQLIKCSTQRRGLFLWCASTNANPAFHHVNNNVVAIVEIARRIPRATTVSSSLNGTLWGRAPYTDLSISAK